MFDAVQEELIQMLNTSLVDCDRRAQDHKARPSHEAHRLREMESVRFSTLCDVIQTVYPMPVARAIIEKASAMYEGKVQ